MDHRTTRYSGKPSLSQLAHDLADEVREREFALNVGRPF